MYPTTELFDRRIRQGGKRKTVVDIFYNNIIVETDVPVSEGDIRIDRSANIRRTASITIADKSLVPSLHRGGVLEPYGTEFRVRHGIVYSDGSEELLPCGVFVLDTTSWNEAEGPIPAVDLVDRASIMARAQIGPALGASGKVAQTFLNSIFSYFWPELTITYGPDVDTSVRVPGGVVFDSGDHWTIVQQMAALMGGEIYFDQDGEPVVTLNPRLDSTVTVQDAVYTIGPGENGVLVDASRSITRNEVFNSVYVVGQATEGGSIPIGHVFNNDPASPTYREGPFRKMGIRIENNLLTTNSACITYANRELARYRHLARSLSLVTVGNPALDAGDIIAIEYMDETSEPGIAESINLPLAGGTMAVEVLVERL